MSSKIRIKLLQLVLNNPEIKRDAIRAHQEFEDEEDRTLANLLYNAKEDGQIVHDEGLHYTITAKGREYLKGAGVELPAAGKKPRGRMSVKARDTSGNLGPATTVRAPEIENAKRTNGTARAIATKLLIDAQGALDEYIASVCNPAVLSRFKAARDQARELVGSFDETGEGAGGGERE